MAMERFERCRDMFADLFGKQKDLSLLDKPNEPRAPPLRGAPGPPPRAGTLPVNGDRSRGPPPPRGPTSPDKRAPPPRRPRGLSESSVMDKEREVRGDREREKERNDRLPRTESEERRRRERRKERDERHRREKEKIRNGGKTKRPQGLDIIDKLDVTGIYGQGRKFAQTLSYIPTAVANRRAVFHHDGPFDACNPHRNAKKDRRAPMQAFPANSANMQLGGAGPLNPRIDLDRFHGRGEEAFDTFATTRKADTKIVDPTQRIEQIHGDESTGLGTSTFLDGAPASKREVQRRDSELDQQPNFGPASGGLARKKSLVQRFRGMSASRRMGPGGDLRSPDARYYNQDGGQISPTTGGASKALSAGGPLRARYTKENEVNPFDNDYEDAYEKKGAQIRIAEQEGRPLVPKQTTSPATRAGPGLGLTRSVTADSAPRPGSGDGEVKSSSGGGGFLSRMKSLKGGRRARPERRDS